MNCRSRIVLLPLLALLVANGTLRPLETCLPGARIRSAIAGGIGGSGLIGVLGGMRAAVASGFWLQANQAWEDRDEAKTKALLWLTVAADDRPLYFWLNGARILAYDIPVWGDAVGRPEAARRKAAGEGAVAAHAFLEAALKAHPHSPEVLIEMANIHLRVGDNPETAAALFRRAAEQPRAPYYAARLHGELLRALGRREEALAWLKAILPGLPANDPAAARAVVEQRIKALEEGRQEK